MNNGNSRSDWLRIHNRAAHDYINTEWSREVLFGVRRMRRKLFAQAVGDVLDVGCGYGLNFPYLTHARSITAVDFSPVMLEKARNSLHGTGIQVDLRKGDAEALPFADNTFDTVISALSTCSFFDPVKALREMRRVCKSDGKILLVEHGRSSWEWLGKYQDRHVHEQIELGGCRWNQNPQQVVKEAGLRIVQARRNLFGVFHTMLISPEK